MRGDPKSWRQGRQSAESKKRELMRRAKTSVESSHGLGGLPKEKGHKPKPVTLPKMPWDDDSTPQGGVKHPMTEFEIVSAKYQKAKDAYWKAESALAAARHELTIAERARNTAFDKEVNAARSRVAVGGVKEP